MEVSLSRESARTSVPISSSSFPSTTSCFTRSSRNVELHADLIAGYYLGKRRWSKTNLAVFGQSLFSKGDYDFNSPDHHGTPKQRLEAMLEGYRLADVGGSFAECAAAGAAYVRGLT